MPAFLTRRVALVGAAFVLAFVSASVGVTVPVAAAPDDSPYAPPSVTIETPSTDGCPQRDTPPPAVDASEDVPDGQSPPEPLPVPASPVGGAQLGGCGLILPPNAPALPSDISAAAWLIADLDSGVVLAAKDPHGRYRPASTLKLLTAQVMLTNLKNLEQMVAGTQADTAQEGTRVGIEAGGQYSVKDLISYLVMRSGNDAANALARVNGGYDKTVADMNATATALGALDTRAVTPSGLDGPGQTTSAYDLALFARADMQTPPFPEIIARPDIRVRGAEGEGYIAANDNQLLAQYPGALGGKTGFTDDAGNTFVGMAAKDGKRLVVTMMNGTQQPRRQWMQAASLLDWGFALPAGSAPVGELVNSLAEATAGPSPTPSVPSPAPVNGSAAASTPASAAESSRAATTPTAGESSSGIPVAWILAGIGILVVAAGVVLLIRRRHLNNKATFAGDAKPKPAPGEPDASAEPAAAPTVSSVIEPSPAAATATEGTSSEPDASATGPSKPDASAAGPTETSASETGATQAGASETGASEAGASETGASETGSSDTGSSDTGSSDTEPR